MTLVSVWFILDIEMCFISFHSFTQYLKAAFLLGSGMQWVEGLCKKHLEFHEVAPDTNTLLVIWKLWQP